MRLRLENFVVGRNPCLDVGQKEIGRPILSLASDFLEPGADKGLRKRKTANEVMSVDGRDGLHITTHSTPQCVHVFEATVLATREQLYSLIAPGHGHPWFAGKD